MADVLKNEGGDAAGDSGLTNMGISQAADPNVDIRNLTVEQACAIYQRDYWYFRYPTANLFPFTPSW